MLRRERSGRSTPRHPRSDPIPRSSATWFPVRRRHRQTVRRICPICVADPNRGVPLTATIPLMLSCPEHGCRLEAESAVNLADALGKPVPNRPASEHILALDRLTFEGLTTGAVTLPRRPVHVGVWFRLLRTLLDEVSISASRVRRHSAVALEQIWDATGWPPRAGLTVWRPYETLDLPRQEAMLEAAATALHLAETGAITARGTLGQLLIRQPHRPVYDGDQPQPDSAVDQVDHWARAREELTAALESARTDPGTARQLLTMLTFSSRTLAIFNRRRHDLVDLGIPEHFLPGPREIGRADLLADEQP
jgi:hypothetical protein